VSPAASRGERRLTGAPAAALAYGVLAVAYTWPLATRLKSAVPWDLGDSLLNDWILAWHYRQAGLVLSGAWSEIAWWHPPIFHPSPYAIAYSELLVTQALLGAPLFALTGSLLLTYNVLFLASFALSALGAFLLVREMTGSARAGWVAGLIYGFALYRVAQAPHLQVLHAQWAPFVLYGLHRYFAHGRWRAAAGAGVALAAQNLSNGYYLFYLALLLPPYVVAQVVARRRVRDWRAWAGPLLAASIAAALTVPLMYPYLQLRRMGEGARPLSAVIPFSADTQAWLTASGTLRLWGWLQTLPRPEGELFPGLTPLILAAAGLGVVAWRRAAGPGREAGPTHAGVDDDGRAARRRAAWTRARQSLGGVAAASLAWHTVAICLALFAATKRLAIGPLVVSFGDGRRLLILWTSSLAVLAICSVRARRVLCDAPDTPVVTLAALAVATVWFSFGPVLHVGGWPDPSWPTVYGLIHDWVPGANALRVPPRIAMMTAMLLAMLGGIAVAAWRRAPVALVGALSALVLAEAWVAPIPMNLVIDAGPAFERSPDRVAPDPARDPEAMALASLAPDAVIAELPLGSVPYELRWQYLAAAHWRPRVNGFSGGAPADYSRVEHVLGALPERADEATRLLRDYGVTHIVVRPAVWTNPEVPAAIAAWLSSLGAARVPMPVPSLEVWELPRLSD
jgi:hypothetical protein